MARKIDIEHLNTFTAYLAEKIYAIFVKKQFGKGLSENDYTDEEKAKLSGIAEGANKTVTDTALNAASENPIQNKAVKAEADRLQGEIDQKVPASRTVNGHALTANVNLTAADVGADASGSAAAALQNAKSYADKKIVDLVGGAPETLDTLKEVSDALEANADVVEALDAAIGTKASAEALNTHVNNKSNPHNVTKAQIGLGNVENKTGAAIRGEMTKAEVVKALGYTPPQTDTNTTYGAATQSVSGLMSAADKKKLDGIAAGAQVNSDSAKNVLDSGNNTATTFAYSKSGLETAAWFAAWSGYELRAISPARVLAVIGAAAASHTHTAGQVSGLPSSLPANGGTANYANYLNATNIPANANLNSYTTPGFYYCPANATVATLSNKPTGNAFFMIVGKHAGTYQLLVEYMTASFKVYMRNYYNSAWGAWVRAYTTIDKPTISDIGAASSGHSHSEATQSANGLMSAADKKKLDGIAAGANNYTYTHPTSAGNKHIPAGGAAGQILRWSAAGTAVWGADNNTTYSAATQSAAGLMSAADKKKLDGIVLEEETEANIDKIIAGTYA